MSGARPRIALAAALAAVVTVLAGCGIRPTDHVSGQDLPHAAARPPTVSVFLLRKGKLVKVQRPGLTGTPQLSILQLAVPVTDAEGAAGLTTEIRVKSLWIDVKDLGPDQAGPYLNIYPGEEVKWTRGALAQLACTAEAMEGINGRRPRLTSAPNVERPVFRVLRCEQFDDLR